MTDLEKVTDGLRACISVGENGVTHSDCRICPYAKIYECRLELERDALKLLKEQEAEIKQLKRPDCEHAEHDGLGCLGYCGCKQDDEPVESCKRCKKYTGNIAEAAMWETIKETPNKITAVLKVTATAEFFDDEASEETVRYVIEQDLEGAGFDVDVVLLKEQPEVVRCKDCKYGAPTIINGVCLSVTCGGLNHRPDWFCADGKRKDDD